MKLEQDHAGSACERRSGQRSENGSRVNERESEVWADRRKAKGVGSGRKGWRGKVSLKLDPVRALSNRARGERSL